MELLGLWFTIKFEFGSQGKGFGTHDLVGKIKNHITITLTKAIGGVGTQTTDICRS